MPRSSTHQDIGSGRAAAACATAGRCSHGRTPTIGGYAPYATPCTHDQACIRCPMLHIDHKMIRRLDEIETDLVKRRERAEIEGWIGEIEGVDLTLTFLRSKRIGAVRLSRRIVSLGRPRQAHEETPS